MPRNHDDGPVTTDKAIKPDETLSEYFERIGGHGDEHEGNR
jgi:hypothetical protein